MEDTINYSLQRVREHSFTDQIAQFEVETEGPLVHVTIRIYKGGVIRYSMTPLHRTIHNFKLINPEYESRRERFTAEEEDGSVILRSPKAEVKINLDPWKLIIYNTDGAPVISELPADLDAHDNYLSSPTGFQAKSGEPHKCWINFKLDIDEKLFGLGERFTDLIRRGKRIVCWNENAFGAGSEKAYKNIPFIVSTRGYGLFLNASRRSVWDIGCSSNFATSIEVDGPCFDIFIIVGKNLKQLLGQYKEISGSAPLPPRWSFGLWISPYGTHRTKARINQKALLELAGDIRKRGIPCEVIHLDPFWMGDKDLCSFKWDKQSFPQPKGMIKELKNQGFRLCLWEHPYIQKDTELYVEGAEKGYFLKQRDGSVYDANLVYISPKKRGEYSEIVYAPGGIVDFSNPEAAEWYKSKHRPLLEMGVAAFKSDFGEAIPEDSCFSNGMSGTEMHNVYPLLYNKTVYEVTREYHERPVVWGRSGFAGSQQYPVQWSGDPRSDFKSLAASIRGGLSYGLSGVPFWTCDLGGFKGEPSEQVFVRWAQVGLLLSHSRFHGTTARLPWAYGERAFAIIKKYIHLRYKLLPYIYGLSLEAVRTGVPVMRALSLEFESEPGSSEAELEYMLGPYILVVPVLNPEGKARIYLPKGDWYDYWTGKKIHGPALINKTFKLDRLPIYIRSNAVLPVTEQEEAVPDLWDPLIINIFPGARGCFEIPEEKKRKYTKLAITEKGDTKIIRALGPKREWKLSLYDLEKPKAVKVFTASENKWSYIQSTKTIEVLIGRCGEFELELKGN